MLRAGAATGDFEASAPLSDDRWIVEGCPHTGARLTEAPDGKLWAVWFTAGGAEGPGLYVTSSEDRGKSFVAFTCRAETGTEVVVADWRTFEEGRMDWSGCIGEALPEHHH